MNFSWDINTRRIKISTAMGIVAGAICLYGTITSIPGMLTWPVLATIFYDRVLLGFVVGIAYGLRMHPLIRGAVIGAVVSLLIAIPSGITGVLRSAKATILRWWIGPRKYYSLVFTDLLF